MNTMVYIIQADKYIKIGIAENVQKRLATLQTASPVPLDLIFTFICGSQEEAKNLELNLHDFFKFCHQMGEWYLSNNVISALKNDYPFNDPVDFLSNTLKPSNNAGYT